MNGRIRLLLEEAAGNARRPRGRPRKAISGRMLKMLSEDTPKKRKHRLAVREYRARARARIEALLQAPAGPLASNVGSSLKAFEKL